MSTSDRIVVAEAGAAVLLVVVVAAILSPGDVMLHQVALHPVWMPIVLLSARYGTRGFFPALVLGWGGLAVASLATGGTVDGLSAHSQSTIDLLALATTIMVAWIAMLHESRIARADQRLIEATEAKRHAEDNVRALHSSLGYLRSRHDRLASSISLWRSQARRLEHGDAADAAKAALELCEIRAGARAGVVQLGVAEDRVMPLARRGAWSHDGGRVHDLVRDATVQAAIRTRQVCPAGPGAAELDADVAIPVLDDASGAVIGVIALRGVSPGCMRAADLRDVGVIAQWLAPSLMKHFRSHLTRPIEATP